MIAAAKAFTKAKTSTPGRNGSNFFSPQPFSRGFGRDSSASRFSNITTTTNVPDSPRSSFRSSGSNFSELPFRRGSVDQPTKLQPKITSQGYASTRDYHSTRRSEGNWVGGTSRVYSPRNSLTTRNAPSTHSSNETTPKTVESGIRLGNDHSSTSIRATTTASQTSNRSSRNERINQLFRTSASTQTDAASSTGIDKNGLATSGLKGVGLTSAAAAHGLTSGGMGFAATKYQTDKKMELVNRATGYMEKHGIPWIPGGASVMPNTAQHTGGHNYVNSPHGVNPYTYGNVGEISNAFGVGSF
jgi:hypothetical protein